MPLDDATLSETPQRSPRALARELNGDHLLIHVDSGIYYTLNDVGGRVWKLCDGVRSVGQIVAAVCEEFDGEPSVIEADVVELVADLAREQLVVIVR